MAKEVITSKDNEKIKLLKKLSQKKYRRNLGLFKVENLKTILGAEEASVQFESIYITEGFISKHEDFVKLLGANYFIISESVNKSFSELDTAPGICAVFKLIDREINFNEQIVYLNNISDPGNLGTILRNALAFGLKNIVVDEDCADIYNSKTLQAAKDSIYKLNIASDDKLHILKEIKSKMKIYTTRIQDAETIDVLKKLNNFCLVLGSEAHGVAKEIQEISDGFIKIDMAPNIESLNVASAAAILFYEMSKP